MQVNIKRSVLSRLISCVLAALMLVGVLPGQPLSAQADSGNGDFELSLSWNKIDADCADPNDPSRFVYDSGTEETRLVRLKVAYSNKQVSRAFDAGEITITVPGLKGAVRSGNSYKPTIAADNAATSQENKQYDWSYTYTEATDTYTFTYNKDIQANSTFEGSFELVWKLPSRETVDGFEGELTAELFTSEADVVSNTLTYTQTRKRDEYTVKEDASPLFDETLPLDNHHDYIWVKYDVTGSDTYYARDVEGSETFELYFLDGAEVFYPNGKISDSGRTENIDGKTYRIWTVTNDITKQSDPKYISDIFVAYPRDIYQNPPYYGDSENNELIHSIVKIKGKYYEEDDEVTLAEYDLGLNLQDYDFSDVPGPIYNVEKNSYGIHMDSIDGHDAYCKEHGAVNSLNLSDGNGFYYSTFELELYYTVKSVTVVAGSGVSSTEYEPADSYRLEFVDDIIDVQLKDGSLRQLRDDEYEFTNVYIPPNSSIVNANGYPVKADKYNVEVYVRTAEMDGDGELIKQCNNGYAAAGTEPRYNGNFDTTAVWTGKITGEEQWVSLPADTVGVKIVVYDVTESWFLDTIGCQYKFHTDDEDIMTHGGQIINNMHFNLIGTKDGEELEPNYMQFSSKHYGDDESGTEDSREYQRDMEIYGHALDRENAVTHIIEIPNEFKLSGTTIALDASVSENGDGFANGAYYFNGSIFSEFTLGEGTELSNFSIYTIVPDGLRLTENANDADSLLSAVSFYSSGGYSSAYIASHTTIEIIDDPLQYDGRQYIAFNFDFSDDPITTKTLNILGIPMYVFSHNLTQGSISYMMHSAMLVDQPGKWYSNGVDNNSMENGVWVDIDRDGDTTELASFASGYVEFEKVEKFHMELTKFVQTPFTKGMVNPDPKDVRDEDGKATAAAPMTYAGGEYSYFLNATVVSGVADHVVFADVIEPEGLSDWQGEFVGVDYSQIVEKLEYPEGAKKEPTIYYSSSEKVFTKTVDGKTLLDRDSFKTEGWTTEKPDVVRSIAVDFGEGRISSGMSMVLEIKMKAPTSVSGCYRLATNSCSVGYNWIEEASGDSSNHPDYLSSNTVPVTYVPSGKIILSKKDEVTDANITDARFELYREEDGEEKDTLIGEYETNGNGIITVDSLEYGTYYFVETEAPLGYVRSDSKLYVTVSEDDPSQRVNFENERKKGQFTLTKISDRTKQLLSGAEFELYNADGTHADEKTYITDASGELTVKDLAWGKYYLLESKAPKGYRLSEEKIEFEINAETAEDPEGKTVENEQKPAKATLVKCELDEGHEYEEVTKSSQIGDVAIKGAVYRLYDSNGNQISTGVTDADGKIYAEDLTFGDYYFEEVVAATGYEKYPERIEFTVGADETEKALVIGTADSRRTGNVWLQKLDDEKESVKDAVYGLYDSNGKLLTVDEVNTGKKDGKYIYVSDGTGGSGEMITSSEGIIEVEGLYWGDYYIKEIKAPTGYALDETAHEFTVDKNNVAATVMIYSTDPRIKGKAELTKVDEADEDTTLEGAVFTLYRNDGTVYDDDLVTDGDGKITVDELEWGSYYFLEKTAPRNYGLNDTKIRFSVNYLTAGKTQELVVTDPKLTYKLELSKAIEKSTAVTAHGNPTFTFKIENTETKEILYRTIAFSGNNLQGEGTAEASVSVALTAGTYKITEMDSDRYEIGTILVDGKQISGTEATVELGGNDTEKAVSVKFENDKTDQSGTSDNSTVNNMLRREKKITAISAVYSGPAIVTDTEQIEANLMVYAIYDDESMESLLKKSGDANGYVLDPDPSIIDGAMNGSTTITVTYKPESRTYKDTFNINIDLPSPFTAQFVTKNADGTYSNVNTPDKFTDTDGTEYDGLVKITGYIGDSSVVNFPSSLTGYIWTGQTNEDKTYSGKRFKVVGIENLNPSDMNTVYIKNGKTSVSSISFAEGIEYIGPGAFREFKGLTCNLELPGTLKLIGHHAFWGDENLTCDNLTIPYGVTNIGAEAFTDCKSLKGTLTIPGTVKNIESTTWVGAFTRCSGFTKLVIEDGVTKIGNYAFQSCSGLQGDLTIPDSVETIGQGAFYDCTGLNGSLTLPNNPKFTEIKPSTFNNCINLTGSLVIPDTVTSIGDNAFVKCGKLTGDLNIPDTVKKIDKEAFAYCSSLDGVLTLSKNLTSIGNSAFSCCYKLETPAEGLYIPDSVEVLGNRAFRECYALSGDLHLPENSKLTAIEMNTFYQCYSLTGTLTIPSNIKKIGYGAFYYCNKLSGLVFDDGIEEISVSISGENAEGKGAFHYCEGLTGTLKLPSTVKIVGYHAFDSAGSISSLELSSNLTSIGEYAFRNWKSISGELKIPDGVKDIGESAFEANTNISSLVLNDSLISIGKSAFRNCQRMEGDLKIPMSVERIDDYAFSGCYWYVRNNNNAKLTIPQNNSLTSIGQNAFSNCFFDSATSEVWIAIDLNDSSDSAKGVEVGKLYYEGQSGAANIDSGIINTSQTSVGSNVFFGYQLKYGFFQRG